MRFGVQERMDRGWILELNAACDRFFEERGIRLPGSYREWVAANGRKIGAKSGSGKGGGR